MLIIYFVISHHISYLLIQQLGWEFYEDNFLMIFLLYNLFIVQLTFQFPSVDVGSDRNEESCENNSKYQSKHIYGYV